MRKAIACGALTLILALGVASAASPEKMLTLTGTVSKLSAAERRLVVTQGDSSTTFVWSAETKINGTLSPGAKVTVRYTTLGDGQNLAHQISVGR